MFRAFLSLSILALTPFAALAQSGFWYPNCSRGSCAPSVTAVPSCPVCPTAADPAAVSFPSPPAAGTDAPLVLPSDSNAPPTPVDSASLPPPTLPFPTPPPAAGQPSPSDLTGRPQNEELETLRRDLERLRIRNQELEESVGALRDNQRDQEEDIQRQLKSIFDSVAKLKADPADERMSKSVRELQDLVESLPKLIDESVRLRIEELSRQRDRSDESKKEDF